MLGAFPCTCRGENENCFRCHGTGSTHKQLLARQNPTFELAAKRQSIVQAPSEQQLIQDAIRRLKLKADKADKAALKFDTLLLKAIRRLKLKADNAQAVVKRMGPPRPGRQVAKARAEIKDLKAAGKAFRAEKKPAPALTTHPNPAPHSEKSLDANQGLHAFRDHGQFGSYPSHDDMGDESAP